MTSSAELPQHWTEPPLNPRPTSDGAWDELLNSGASLRLERLPDGYTVDEDSKPHTSKLGPKTIVDEDGKLHPYPAPREQIEAILDEFFGPETVSPKDTKDTGESVIDMTKISLVFRLREKLESIAEQYQPRWRTKKPFRSADREIATKSKERASKPKKRKVLKSVAICVGALVATSSAVVFMNTTNTTESRVVTEAIDISETPRSIAETRSQQMQARMQQCLAHTVALNPPPLVALNTQLVCTSNIEGPKKAAELRRFLGQVDKASTAYGRESTKRVLIAIAEQRGNEDLSHLGNREYSLANFSSQFSTRFAKANKVHPDSRYYLASTRKLAEIMIAKGDNLGLKNLNDRINRFLSQYNA